MLKNEFGFNEHYEELTGYEEHLHDSMDDGGDPRRCPKHPHVKTSSDDGMFDCDCYVCEGESEEAYQRHTAYIELHANLPVACGDNGADTGYGPACVNPSRFNTDEGCFVSAAQFNSDNEIPF